MARRGTRLNTLRFQSLMLGTDAAALVAAGLLAGWRGAAIAGLVAIGVAFLDLAGARAVAPLNPRAMDEAAGILGRLAIAIAFAVALAVPSATARTTLTTALAAFPCVLVGRALAYAALRSHRRRKGAQQRALIIGSGEQGSKLAATLLSHPEFGLEPVGFIDERSDDRDLPAALLGDIHDLPAVVQELDAHHVIVAHGAWRDRDLIPVLRSCGELPVEIYVLPRFHELGWPRSDDVWGIPLVRLERRAFRTRGWRLKRLFDRALAPLLLLVGLPLLVAAATAVRLSSRGPILFRQKRVGQDGAIFEILKFRTLAVADSSDTTWGLNGARPTRVGRILRRTHIDELPQLINVIRGEMSLVGPRPELPFLVDRFSTEIPRYTDRHRVLPGLTGWAQVHGLIADETMDERRQRTDFDNAYIEGWSLWRDLVILGRTGKTVMLRPSGRRR